MNKDTVKKILYIILALILGVLAFKFFIWLLPVIVVGILAYLIYNSIKKNKNTNINNNKDKYKEKNIKVIHDLDDED